MMMLHLSTGPTTRSEKAKEEQTLPRITDVRVVSFHSEAAKLAEFYRGRGMRVRVTPRTIKAERLAIDVFVVVIRDPAIIGQWAD